MEKYKFSTINTELLVRKRNLIKNICILFTSIFLVISILLVTLFFTKSTKDSLNLLFPIFVFPLALIPLFTNLRRLDLEIKERTKKTTNQTLNYI